MTIELESKPNGSAISRWGKAAAALLLYVVLYGYYTFKNPGNLIIFLIILVFLLLYIQFTIQNRFWKWQFYNDHFIRKNLLGFKHQKVKYVDISSWQIRERFGSNSNQEYIPNYTEVAFWITHKNGLHFNEIDYQNYMEMQEYFISKMQALQIEPAPYRE